MIKNLQKFVLVTALCFFGLSVFSQGVIKGKIVDANDEKFALIGATVVIEGTTKGTAANIDGSFSLKVSKPNVTLVFSYMGYIDLKKEVSIPASGEKDLGLVPLESNSVGLEEIQITTSFVRDRATPIAVSTIDPYIIAEKLGPKEFPEILKSTPSVYATKSGGGFGDSRIFIRGFDSNNIGVLINGVPVNDMESGKVYWSNWAGLSDVTQNKQVQRGLGASRLALSSVGGTINIITKSTDVENGGQIYTGIGNDGYRKQTFNVSTGLLDNGWAITLAGGRTIGNGYVESTEWEGWSYFANVSKIINKKHRLSLTAFGAPQWHNQRYHKNTIQTYRKHPDGAKYNMDWGYRNGQKYNSAYNFYHKPQISLNHTWSIDETSMLSTAAYVSLSNGGGRRVYGSDVMRDAEGLIDWNGMIERNANAANGSESIIANSNNSHDWYGVLSTYTKNISSLKLSGGFDGRYYKGYHNYTIDDLLGGKYFLNNSDKNRNPSTPLHKGDIVNYHNTGEVMWLGLFAQGEYITDNFSSFLSGSVAQNKYRRADYFQYKPGEQITDWLSFYSWTVKGGASYKITEEHTVFANGGYITRAPYFRTSFIGYTNDFNKDAKNETIITAELGYKYASHNMEVFFNLYRTNWRDKGLVKNIGDVVANIPGLNALHQGAELEIKYKATSDLTLKGMFSLGDWIWQDDVIFDVYDRDNVYQGTFNAYTKNVHVGNSAQMTAFLSADYKILPKLKIGIDGYYYGKNFSEFDPTNRLEEVDAGIDSWQLPDAFVMDINANYKFKIGKLDATIYGNLNNLFDTEYIADAYDGNSHDEVSGTVFYGFGRNWSTGLRIKF